MKKFLAMLLAAAMVFALCACGQPAAPAADTPAQDTPAAPAQDTPAAPETKDEQTWTLSMASFQAADGTFNNDVEKAFANAVYEKTNGRVTIDIYSGGSLLANGEIYAGVVAGVADIGVDCPNMYVGRFPYGAMFEYPGTGFVTSEAASYAFQEGMQILDPEELKDTHSLMLWCTGPTMIICDDPLDSRDAFVGKQIRISNTMFDVIEALGGTPVSMATTDVYEALRLGTINGYGGAAESLSAFHFGEVSDYITMFPLQNGTFFMFMNNDVYNSLPADIQAAIDEAAAEVYPAAAGYFNKYGSAAIDYAVANEGCTLVQVADDEMDAWLELCAPILQNYADELDAQGYDGAGCLKLLRELVEKYNALYPAN